MIKKKRDFLFNLNFLDSPQESFFILNFQKGSVKWIYNKNIVKVKNYNSKTKVYKFQRFKRNQMFKDQTKNFIEKVLKRKFSSKSLLDSFNTIKLIKKIKLNQIDKKN